MAIRFGAAGLRRGRGFATLINVRRDCELVAVCDLNRERAEQVAREVGCKAFDDYDAFCAADLDAVVIVTPPSTHLACTRKAMAAGKHVLCEIPVVMSLEEADDLLETVRRSGRIYMAAENVNYFPIVQEMHRLVREGRIGRIAFAEGEYIHDCRHIVFDRDDGLGGGTHDAPSWRGEFEDIRYCTHELGPLLMMIDEPIVSAVCSIGAAPAQRYPGEVRAAAATFQTSGGRVIRELRASSIAKQPEFHFLGVYGTVGAIETNRYRWYQELMLYTEAEGKTQTIPCSLTHADAPPEASAGGHGTSEYYMIGDFIQAIINNEPPYLDVVRGLEMTVPGICAAESGRRGGIKINVPTYR